MKATIEDNRTFTEEDLKKEFPEFMKADNMSCCSGWYPIIYDLANNIRRYCKKNNLEMPFAHRIREKFGCFVCDLNWWDKKIMNYHVEAQSKALKTDECSGYVSPKDRNKVRKRKIRKTKYKRSIKILR